MTDVILEAMTDRLSKSMVVAAYKHLMPECIGCMHAGVAGATLHFRPNPVSFDADFEIETELGCLNKHCTFHPSTSAHRKLSDPGSFKLVGRISFDSMSKEMNEEHEAKLDASLGKLIVRKVAHQLDIGTEVKRITVFDPLKLMDEEALVVATR